MRANLKKAQYLINTATDLDLQMALPKGIPSLCTLSTSNYTRSDNVLVSSSLANAVMHCNTMPEEWPMRLDHMAIITQLDTSAEAQPVTPHPNYRLADWKKVRERLAAKLEMLQSGETFHMEAEFFTHLDRLMQAITDTVDDLIPKLKPAPFHKCWWSRELDDRCREVLRVAHRVYGRRSEPGDPTHQSSWDQIRGTHQSFDISRSTVIWHMG